MLVRTAVAVAATCLLVACSARSSSDPASGAGDAANAGIVIPDGPCVGSSTAAFVVPGIARGLAVDDAFVYTATTDAVVRAPRGGGAAEKLASMESATSLAADATSLYFFGSHDVGTPNAEGKVMSGVALYALPLAGGAPRLLVDGAYGQVLVSDGTDLYWNANAAIQQLSIASAAAAASSSIERAALVEAMALGRDSIFLAVYAISTDGPGTGSIRRIPRGGGPVTTIIDGLRHPTSIALDETRLYFTDEGFSDGAVQSALLDGTDVKTIANVASSSVAVDAHAVYYTTGDGITKFDKTTGVSTQHVTGLRTPGNLVVRGGNLYWLNATSVAFSEPNPPYGVMGACK